MQKKIQKLEQKFSTGSIELELYPSQWQAEDLFAFAERKNIKRSFLFVSKVLGKYIPVPPARMRETYQTLAKQIPNNLEFPILFIGMAETAVGLASGIFQEALIKYPESILLTTTRYGVDGEILCEFKEEHSHATDHILYWPQGEIAKQRLQQAKIWVFLDDEATTGNTFINLFKGMIDAGLAQPKKLLTVTLTDWSGARLRQSLPCPVQQISLLKGHWKWRANEKLTARDYPNVSVTRVGLSTISTRQDWGRLGMIQVPDQSWLYQYTADQVEHLLVLGTAEFTYMPFLLAEYLETLGATVLFASTARSPILPGMAIDSILSFVDNYGLGITNYCYNIANQKFDRILICIETDEQSFPSSLLHELRKIAPQVEIIIYE